MSRPRSFDLVVFGATGFSGKLVVDYLARTTGKGERDAGLRWAIAGRNRDKLLAVRAALAVDHPRLAELPIVVADSADPAALDALVEDTRVVCTTVGPYRKYGVELVRACARHGTHYCDITGEIPFIRMSIDDNHAVAQRTGARIVHACGFDSIPSDIGSLMLVDHARQQGERVGWIHSFVQVRGTGAPGGVESAITLIQDSRRDPALRKLAANPGALDPTRTRHPRDQLGVRFDRELGQWTAPFVMALVNTRMVRRSAALLDYGPGFRYEESMNLGTGAGGFAKAGVVTLALGVFATLAYFKPLNGLLRRLVHLSPGGGGMYNITLLGRTESGTPLSMRVAGTGDPGHEPTAMMLAESALALTRETPAQRTGVLTPASAFGLDLVPGLRRGGMTLEVAGEAETAQRFRGVA